MGNKSMDFVEIRVSDLTRSNAFYGALFGWKIDPYPMHVPASMAWSGKLPMVCLMQLADGHAPANIVPYFTVEDCEETARRAVAQGATVTMGKTAVEEYGWFTGVVDPWGNEVNFWQERDPDAEATAPTAAASQDHVCWVDLLTDNLDGAVHFWMQAMGWSFHAIPEMPGFAFVEHYPMSDKSGMHGVAIGARKHEHSANVYVQVSDLAKAEDAARANGGEVLESGVPIIGTGHYSTLRDPDGNRIAVIKIAPRA